MVTVEPIPDRLENHNHQDILGTDVDADDQNRNLRLKGKQQSFFLPFELIIEMMKYDVPQCIYILQ